jgi:hypothetical protein
VKEPTTTSVFITIVKVEEISCTVHIRGVQFENVLVPYGKLKAGQKFTATMTKDGFDVRFDGWEKLPPQHV